MKLQRYYKITPGIVIVINFVFHQLVDDVIKKLTKILKYGCLTVRFVVQHLLHHNLKMQKERSQVAFHLPSQVFDSTYLKYKEAFDT